MAWIQKIPVTEATGRLKHLFDEAVKRAGRVFQIVHLQSINPPVMEASLELFKMSMFGQSPLRRYQREMIAVVVSRVNECHY